MSKKQKIILTLRTMFLAVVVMSAMGLSALAANAIPSKVRLYPKYYKEITFDLPSYGDTVKNIKSSSKYLKTRKVGHSINYSKYNDSGYNRNEFSIGALATKKGTYTISFDIYNRAGKKKSSKKITAYCQPDSPVKSFKYGGKQLIYDLLRSRKGKISVTMNSGYKLKKLTLNYPKVTKDKYGNSSTTYVEKTIKNNSTITFPGTRVKYVNEDGKIDGDYYYSYSSDSMVSYSYITVYYIDKYTKQEDNTSYGFDLFIG